MSRLSYDEIVHRIVPRPAAISRMEEIHSKRLDEIHSARPEELDFGALDLLMECEFPAPFYYLPAAWNYVEQMRQEWPQVAWSALQVIASSLHELNAYGIYQPTLDRILEVFDSVTGSYEVQPSVKMPWVSVVGGSGRVDFVDAIFKFNIPCGESTLFDTVMNRWANPWGPWQRSATFLDFFMRKDWSATTHLKKALAPPQVKALRQNHELLRRHWARAKTEVTRLCPPDYCEYLVGAVLR